MTTTRQTYFSAIHVVERSDDGRLKAWYPGEQFASEREAKAEAVRLCREFPGAEYQVVQVTIAERGASRIRHQAVAK